MVKIAAGAVGGHQKDLIGHLPVGFRGRVENGRGGGIRRCHRQIGGTAAVQTQHRRAAQLHQPLSHLGQGRADGMAAFPAVDGIENQGAVRLLAHGGARIRPRRQTGGHRAVLGQTVQGPHSVLHIVPAVVSGNGQRDFGILPHPPQGGGVVRIRLRVGGEDDLIRLKGGDSRLLNPVNPRRHRRADGKRPPFHGADHVDAGLCGAGGVLGIEIVCIEVQSAAGAGLVHSRHRPHQLRGAAEAVICGVAQIRGNLDAGLAQHGGAVGPEADGVIPGIAAAENAVRHHQTDGQSVGDIVKVTVDPGHHPIALPFQCGGHGGYAGTVGQHIAIGDHGRHGPVRRVGDEVLRPKVGIGRAPEHIGGQLRLLMQLGVSGGEILPQRVGRGGGQGQRPQQTERQQQGCDFADAGSHISLLMLCKSGEAPDPAVYITSTA